MPKRYVGTFLLGRQSPTEDIEGDVTELPDAPVPTRERDRGGGRAFRGPDRAAPAGLLGAEGRAAAGPTSWPAQGQPVELAPRPVEIYRIEVKAYQYPELVLEVECGSGTYIRSLGRDLAESLGTAAVMSALVRTADRRLSRRRGGRSPRTDRRQLARDCSSRRFGRSSICPACNSRPTKPLASATD